MDAHSVLNHPNVSEAGDPDAGQDGVCYCGLYEKCPDWVRMNDEERRVCSTDKRMTMEWLWKGGVQGA